MGRDPHLRLPLLRITENSWVARGERMSSGQRHVHWNIACLPDGQTYVRSRDGKHQVLHRTTTYSVGIFRQRTRVHQCNEGVEHFARDFYSGCAENKWYYRARQPVDHWWHSYQSHCSRTTTMLLVIRIAMLVYQL